MSAGDILVHRTSPFSDVGAKKCKVAASATLIYPGEPVVRALGGYVVTKMATSKPVVATDYLEGIATTESTNDASTAGEVWVQPIMPGTVYKMKPTTAATWDTQAEYDALVGDRVTMNLDATSGDFTINATDGSTYGCVIEWIDVPRNPGYVAFSFRSGCSDLT
jgi:hypothetical protein